MVGDRAPLGLRNPCPDGFPQSMSSLPGMAGTPKPHLRRGAGGFRGTVDGMTTDQPASDDPADETTAGMTGEEHLDAREVEILNLADVSAQEIISRSIVVLMSAAAEKLGLSDDEPTSSPNRDLDESRKLITALPGLVSGSDDYLGPQADVVRYGLQWLQTAFRGSSL